jgi:RNA polymerase sigma factor for flagellar operon FliA
MSREELILSLSTKVNIITKMFRRRLPNSVSDDIRQIAWLGAIEAVDKYNPEFKTNKNKSVELSYFANKFIRGRIVDFLRSVDYVSRCTRKKIKKFENRKDRPHLNYDYISIDNKFVFIDDENCILQLKAVTISNTDEEDKKHLAKLLKNIHFTAREKEVLQLRFYEDLSQAEVSKKLKVNYSRISQIERILILKIRAFNNIKDTKIPRHKNTVGYRNNYARVIRLKRMAAMA